jgi:signal peptidase I
MESIGQADVQQRWSAPCTGVRARVACMLIVALAAVAACQKSIYHDYRIPTTSMEPTLARHEKVTVRLLEPGATVRRGDIIVFRQPGEEHKKYMKRVVALAGDSVEIKGDTLLVNGVTQREPYAKYTRRIPCVGPIHVPPDAVFVLGDNRANSLDSRHYGCVPHSNIVGVVKR